MFRRKRRAPRREVWREEMLAERYDAPRGGSGMRQLVGLIAVAFMITLGVVVGTRLSSDAIAVLLGVIAGVAASIPCALLLMAVTRRREQAYEPPDEDGPEPTLDVGRYDAGRYDPRRAMPPVIVVTPGNAAPQQVPPWASWDEALPARTGRQFRVMGVDDSDDEE